MFPLFLYTPKKDLHIYSYSYSVTVIRLKLSANVYVRRSRVVDTKVMHCCMVMLCESNAPRR